MISSTSAKPIPRLTPHLLNQYHHQLDIDWTNTTINSTSTQPIPRLTRHLVNQYHHQLDIYSTNTTINSTYTQPISWSTRNLRLLFKQNFKDHASADPEGWQVPPPWKITKIKGFLATLIRIPWKITKLPNVWWRADDGPILVVFGSTKSLIPSENFSGSAREVEAIERLYTSFSCKIWCE